MSINYTIYALIHPITKEIRYIGYTSKSIEERLRYHYYDLKKNKPSHKIKWLQSLLNDNLKAEAIPLESNIPSLELALQREVYYISIHSNLVNSTSGGEKNKVFNEDVKLKIGASMKGKLVGELNPMFGKKREDLRQRNLNNNPAKDKEIIKGIASTLKKMYNTPEYSEIHRASQKNNIKVVKMNFSGEIEKEYPSIKSTIKDGFGSKEVALCCKGIYNQHKGFKWAFANN